MNQKTKRDRQNQVGHPQALTEQANQIVTQLKAVQETVGRVEEMAGQIRISTGSK